MPTPLNQYKPPERKKIGREWWDYRIQRAQEEETREDMKDLFTPEQRELLYFLNENYKTYCLKLQRFADRMGHEEFMAVMELHQAEIEASEKKAGKK